MIGSKKTDILAVLLTALLLAAIASGLYAAHKTPYYEKDSVKEYGNGHTISYTQADSYTDYTSAPFEKIELLGETASSQSKNVIVNGGDITILAGGTYVISGELTDGCITINSNDNKEVRLVLDNASVTSSDFAAIYVVNSERTVISCPEGTSNRLTDGSVYSEERLNGGKPTAALYSSDDLIINGAGTLGISASFEDGIKSNDGLKILDTAIDLTSADEGINANDYISVAGGHIDINSTGDGIRCEDDDADRGFIVSESSVISINSGGDGIYASSAFYSESSELDITTSDGAVIADVNMRSMPFDAVKTQSEDTVSTKAVKAGSYIEFNNGVCTVNSADDGIHSDGDISINGGSFAIRCGDDAIHGEDNVNIDAESIDISLCREGIEGDYITICGGDINVISSDDGINATGPNSNAGFMPMQDKNREITEEDIYLTVSGGNIFVETSGDGVDSNGAAKMTGGSLKVFGPENGGNSSLDFEYGFIVDGGEISAAGSSQMAELPSEDSAANVLVFYLDSSYEAGTDVKLTDADGNTVSEFTPTKKFDWVLISKPQITLGESYSLYVSGSLAAQIQAEDKISSYGTRAVGAFGGRGMRRNTDGTGENGSDNIDGKPFGMGGNMPADADTITDDGVMRPPNANAMPSDGEMRPPDAETMTGDGGMRPPDAERMPRDRNMTQDGTDPPTGMPADGQMSDGQFKGRRQRENGFGAGGGQMPQDMRNADNVGSIKNFINKYGNIVITAAAAVAGFIFVLLYRRKIR